MDTTLLGLLAKAALGIAGIVLAVRRVRSVIATRRLWRQETRDGRTGQPTAERLRRYRLELTVSLGFVGALLFIVLTALLVSPNVPFWVSGVAFGLAGVCVLVAAVAEGVLTFISE